MLSKASSFKKDCSACQGIDSVDMHKYAKFDQNIPCGSRVLSILLTANGGTDSHSDYSAHMWIVQLKFAYII